jgi:hypothetical protein
MEKYTQEEFNKAFENHQHWLNEDCECWEFMRLDLCDADLSHLNLSRLDLSGLDLSHANLSHADLSFSNLKHTNLSYTDLREARLYGTNMYSIVLHHANLTLADLSWSNLTDADLKDADLTKTKLYGVNLCGANLDNAILTDVRYDSGTAFFNLQCPEEGSFIAFKKVMGTYIVKLEIPTEAKRSSATSRKCRCQYAKVLSITYIDGSDSGLTEVISNTFTRTIYKVGREVYPDFWDDNRWHECSHGIHFFMTREEAVNY